MPNGYRRGPSPYDLARALYEYVGELPVTRVMSTYVKCGYCTREEAKACLESLGHVNLDMNKEVHKLTEDQKEAKARTRINKGHTPDPHKHFFYPRGPGGRGVLGTGAGGRCAGRRGGRGSGAVWSRGPAGGREPGAGAGNLYQQGTPIMILNNNRKFVQTSTISMNYFKHIT